MAFICSGLVSIDAYASKNLAEEKIGGPLCFKLEFCLCIIGTDDIWSNLLCRVE